MMRNIVLCLLVFLLSFSCTPQESATSDNQPVTTVTAKSNKEDTTQERNISAPTDAFGFSSDSLEVIEAKVQWSESMYTILRPYLSPHEIYKVSQEIRSEFHPRQLKVGQRYRLYLDPQEDGSKDFSGWVCQKDPLRYVAVDWTDSLSIRADTRETITYLKTAQGVIHQSLYQTIREQRMPMELLFGISDLFAWQINFFTLQPGDRFSIVYEQQMIDDQQWMIGDIVAAEFYHEDERFTAFRYFKGEGKGFYDSNGESVQKTLLKAPLHYSRISSGFSYNRMHPILHRRMAHLGVDYAAPRGTPVVATGSGKVIESRYRGANGNIVKVRHNSTYTTVYLHLSGFAEGIQRGATVEQGQTIGYVGSTGRSTGPHLDYRVYKHGKPVNPLKLKLPPSKSISDTLMADFESVRDGYSELLYHRDQSLAQTKDAAKRDES